MNETIVGKSLIFNFFFLNLCSETSSIVFPHNSYLMFVKSLNLKNPSVSCLGPSFNVIHTLNIRLSQIWALQIYHLKIALEMDVQV